ncbi:MAG: thiamine-phosphate kinase [Planctomycetota bacterium]
MAKGEDNLIAWLASRPTRTQPGVEVGIGDDMAILRAGEDDPPSGPPILITADMLMDGVHFDTSAHTPEQIGRKALAASLSDCAAMAVRPRYAVVSIALPAGWSMTQAQALYIGMEVLAETHDCAIVGGDTNSWPHPLVIDISIVAVPWPGIEPARRSGVQVGDAVCVTGKLGGSLHPGPADAAGGVPHHLCFEPRVAEARWLAARLADRLHAMMDLSDGLSTDATRMAAASGCGIEFDAAALENVVSDAALAASQADGRTPLDHLLNDGEDFELLFAVAPTSLAALEKSAATGTATGNAKPPALLTRVGTAIEGAGVWLKRGDAPREAIKPGGWQHFTNGGCGKEDEAPPSPV